MLTLFEDHDYKFFLEKWERDRLFRRYALTHIVVGYNLMYEIWGVTNDAIAAEIALICKEKHELKAPGMRADSVRPFRNRCAALLDLEMSPSPRSEDEMSCGKAIDKEEIPFSPKHVWVFLAAMHSLSNKADQLFPNDLAHIVNRADPISEKIAQEMTEGVAGNQRNSDDGIRRLNRIRQTRKSFFGHITDMIDAFVNPDTCLNVEVGSPAKLAFTFFAMQLIEKDVLN